MSYVKLKKTSKQRTGIIRQVFGKRHRLARDILQNFVLILAVKGRSAGEHIVNYATEAKPVGTLSVSFTGNDLGRDVFRCSTHAIGQLALRLADLRESKVGELDMTVAVEQDILRLHIAIDDVAAVKILKREEQFAGVECGYVFVEAAAPAK